MLLELIFLKPSLGHMHMRTRYRLKAATIDALQPVVAARYGKFVPFMVSMWSSKTSMRTDLLLMHTEAVIRGP